jgi:ribokinase
MTKILAMGALLADQIARVDRFPGPDDEVFVPKLEILPGGSAANFAAFCARLGMEVGFLGKIGNDSFGDFLVRDLMKEGVDITGILKTDKLPTGTVYIAVGPNGERRMFAHSGAANAIESIEIKIGYLIGFQHLHMADLENIGILEYLAKKFNGSISLGCGALIAERGVGARPLISNVDILICSKDEAFKLVSKDDVKDCLTELHSWGPKVVVITLGEEGAMAYGGNREYMEDAIRVNVVDTTGAGDAFSAGFLYKYLPTKDIQESLLYGNAAAAANIKNVGARSLKGLGEIKELIGD